MNDLEKQALLIYERWAENSELALNALIELFEIMKEKYPLEMKEAFNRGLHPVAKIKGRPSVSGPDWQ